jgi:para-nitrobenzyl esterase
MPSPTDTAAPRGAIAALLILLVLVAAPPARADQGPPVVAVTGGQVRGALIGGGPGAVFKGIPFAQPPVGELRWREPRPVKAWDGIREATRSGPPAAQVALGWNDAAAAASSEDCLYLDVWTPARRPDAPLPVMVWIHGGANVAGAGGFDPLYEGESLISHGVVLVVVEYRLGVFGFLAHPELTRESPHHASGNYGLMDQAAALRWVHDNIAGFGGDPATVTLFGQSAGSMDVLALMASPLARGLFVRAIAESGPSLYPAPTLEAPLAAAEREGVRAASELGAPAADALAYLRSLPTATLLNRARWMLALNADGWALPATAGATFRVHGEAQVPLIIGSNAIEFPFQGSPAELGESIRRVFGDLAPRALALYGLSGGAPAAPDPLYGNAADQWGSDMFRCPAVVQGEWHRAAGSRTWEYQFDRAIPPHPRTSHSGELAYVFGNLLPAGSQPGDFQEADRRLSGIIQAYWTHFAKTGDPNGPGVPDWPGYDGKSRAYMDFNAQGSAIAAENQRGPFSDLFRQALSRQAPSPQQPQPRN